MIKERVVQGWRLEHLPGSEMLADIGTKPLGPGRLLELMLGLGLHVPDTSPPLVSVASLRCPVSRLQATADEVPVPNVALASPRAQQLLRALFLLELVGSLPQGEAAVLPMPQTGCGGP